MTDPAILHAPSVIGEPESRLRPVALAAATGLLVLGIVLSQPGTHGFDMTVMHVLNRLTGRWPLLDHVAHDMTKESFSTLPMTALVCFAWSGGTRGGTRGQDDRARLIAGTLACIVSIGLCFVLQAVFPDHPRPLHDPRLRFHAPASIDPGVFSPGMAFPAEHAALLFGLAATVAGVDLPLGLACLVLAFLLSLVRVYLGFIYPSDIITGAMIGVLLTGLAQARLPLAAVRPLEAWGRRHPASFCAVSFYVCFGIVRLFEDERYIATGLSRAIKAHLGH
ncbi:phosphatase PAP2 family protein [Lichenicoccus sp.]|uniref:phosphatase PAP2 family protein n=1 Tax=Lichenicoccus sp. TaxID=2781899 RepID=UPI003D0BFBC0